MLKDSSVKLSEDIPHVSSTNTKPRKTKILTHQTRKTERTKTRKRNQQRPKTTISVALKRRAQSVINDRSIDAPTRAVIRYGLETNDPWLRKLLRQVDAGETIFETIHFLRMGRK